MATVIPASPSRTTVPLDSIYVAGNIRDSLDPGDVDRLAGSIALQGLIQPVPVTPATGAAHEQGYSWELIAGFTRYAAVSQLGHSSIDVTVRDPDDDPDAQVAAVAAARATENILRRQLNPHEEAVAVQRMLETGLTTDGAAQALGWSKARVTARLKLLELPEAAQRLIGSGVLSTTAIEPLRSIGAVSTEVLDTLIIYLQEAGPSAAGFVNDPAYTLANALRGSDTFAAYLDSVDGRVIEVLRLGKRATAQYGEIVELEKKLDRYAYASPRVPFTDDDVDQARAAGVLIELPGRQPAPLIVDRALFRDLAKQAIRRHVQTLTDRVAQQAEQRAAARLPEAGAPVDPAREAKREHGRQMRQLAERAHGVNTDLGWALRNELSTVDPADMTVARFFVYALLEGDADEGYGTYGDRARELASRGIRLVIDEFRTDVTKTKKDGSRGALKIDYGRANDTAAARAWLWKFIDGAKTAGELYGRALVVIAAQRHALRLVVPVSQQSPAIGWSSRNDRAEKALAKLVGPHLPASLKQLEKAIATAQTDHEKELAQIAAVEREEAAAARAHDEDRADVPDAIDNDTDAED